jgi:hypothetical protein
MAEEEGSDETSISIRRAECSECGGARNCDIVKKHSQRGGDTYFQYHIDWYLLQCRGCEHVFVQTVSTNTEDYDDFYDEKGEAQGTYRKQIKYWPALSKRKNPDWFSDGFIDSGDNDTCRLAISLTELYGALNHDLKMLAGIGIRTSIDIAAELLGIDHTQSFNAKLQALEKGGHIGKVERSRLEVLVNAGHACAHRGWRPSPAELNTMMDALEHFIYDAFVAPARKERLIAKVATVETKIPPRTPGAKT